MKITLPLAILAGLVSIALAIYHKPMPGRYQPDQIDDKSIILLDTQTGTIHIHENGPRVWFQIEIPNP
jgi:hypothetical protein